MMPWILIIVLSARNGFGGNIEGGVAITTVQFGNQDLCQQAARKVLEVNHDQGFFVSTTCVESHN